MRHFLPVGDFLNCATAPQPHQSTPRPQPLAQLPEQKFGEILGRFARLQWPGVANHMPLILAPFHGAPGSKFLSRPLYPLDPPYTPH